MCAPYTMYAATRILQPTDRNGFYQAMRGSITRIMLTCSPSANGCLIAEQHSAFGMHRKVWCLPHNSAPADLPKIKNGI